MLTITYMCCWDASAPVLWPERSWGLEPPEWELLLQYWGKGFTHSLQRTQLLLPTSKMQLCAGVSFGAYLCSLVRCLNLGGRERERREWVGAVPEIILSGGWAAVFYRSLHPQDKHGVRAPWPPGHVSALINPPHYRSNTPWPPGQVTPPPLRHVNKHPPPTGQKSACGPPSLRIISGTALRGSKLEREESIRELERERDLHAGVWELL